ncbi:MAG: serine/threonine-protein kinase [Gemmatimonadetes bacterium]|nr:serine/threonine-protein kinase [Gemmatimonadota bacterium]
MADPQADRLKSALADRYSIERELGAGGMATVYLARDLKHDRQVAVKVLKPELAAVVGAERFLGEIKVTANLQHPHILPLHDSGEAEGFLFYVMPYVEGESVRERLTREKQLPVADAVRIATEVAAALDYAHRRGVIHRDIKPENILLHDGQALVADFGIALAVSSAGGARLTETGMSLGTPHYMSPEQAMGEREITARSDVYALGVTLYEMLVGEPPFTGPTAQAIVAKLLTDDPHPIAQLRRTVPPHVEVAVMTALEKLPADRFTSGAAFAEALAAGSVRVGGVSRRIATARVAPTGAAWTLGGVAAVATIAALWGWLRPTTPARREATRRAVIELPSVPTLSSDGSLMLYVAQDGSQTAIFARPVASLEGVPIPGTEGGTAPFISPDGSRVGFLREGQIFVVPFSGGGAARVRGATLLGLEAVTPAWTPDGRIVYTDRGGGLIVVRPDGSAPDTLTRPDPGVHHLSPSVLPDGRTVLFAEIPRGNVEQASIGAVSLASKQPRTLVTGGATTPRYVDGHLLYVLADGTLMAVPFDVGRGALTGEPVPLPDRVAVDRFGVASLAVAPGLVIYQRVLFLAHLVELDRGGRSSRLLSEAGSWHHPRYSPNGAAVVLDQRAGEARDVWILGRQSEALSRVTRVGDGHDPVWTPDGKAVTFLSFGTEGNPLKNASADGSGDARPLPPALVGGVPLDIVHPGTWLPDGSGYVAGVRDSSGRSDLWLLPTDGGGPTRLVGSDYDEHSPAVSADGHWLAYRSDETGRGEIYVRALRGGAGRLQVSNAGGEGPVWDKRREALYYLQREGGTTRLIEATLQMLPMPVVVRRAVLIDGLRVGAAGNHANYDVDPTGTRFVAVEPGSETGGLVAVFDLAASLSTAAKQRT